MTDPTYNRKEINGNPIWKASFIMSECLNDAAPLGWSKYVWVVETLVKYKTINFRGVKRKPKKRKGKGCPIVTFVG